MPNKKINSASLRLPTKAYSQGILVPCGNTDILFITGQLPQNIEGEIVHIGDIESQTRVVFDRILNILAEAKMSLDDIVKVQIFLKDINDAKIVSIVRDELFQVARPASTLVEVTGFVKEGCGIEIDAIATKLRTSIYS